MRHDGAVLNDICENDPRFYQACGVGKNYPVKNSSLLCGQLICKDSSGIRSLSCDRVDSEKLSCSNLEIDSICRNQQDSKKCNKICDYTDCFDKAICNGVQYGKFCTDERKTYHSILTISVMDWLDWTYKCELWAPYMGRTARQKFVKQYSGDVCTHTLSGHTVPIFNFTRCAVFQYSPALVNDPSAWWINATTIPYCTNMMDQTNCTDLARVALSCSVGGYETNISKFAICHDRSDIKICDNGIENNCRRLSPSCFVHKHKLCDGISDCQDNSDEQAPDCNDLVSIHCVRVLGNVSLPIPISWLGDGIADCETSEDESDNWPTCGSGQTKRYVANNDSRTDDLLCINSEIKYVPQTHLCDMIDTCGNENEICKISKGNTKLFSKVMQDENKKDKTIPYCIKGLHSVQSLGSNCSISSFSFPPGQTFGMNNTKAITMPDRRINCDYTFGEMYVLASCAGKCSSSSSVCPLSRPLRYDSCSGQFSNRVFTVTEMDYLTFVIPHRGLYYNDYFLCKNNGCVTYDKVCNLVDDCGDGSDEELCTNQFHCRSSMTRIPKWQKCDGHINCEDLSDECNDECGKEIIDGIILKISSWVIGFLAVTFNTVIVVVSLRSVQDITTSMGLLNKLLIVMISIGDFLVGGYLFTISAFDAWYGSSYCSKQTEWRSSYYCSLLGIASTIGSQISLFAMTCMSTARLFGIKNAITISSGISWKSRGKILTLLFLIIAASVGMAFAPVRPRFEDFFINGMRYEKSNPMFVGFPDKNVHFHVLEAYYGRMRGNQNSISWKITLELIDGMFSKTYGGLKREKVGFYGNDGVCLFKYFVTEGDPQKIFTWTILSINFFCFLIISLNYMIINFVSVQSGRTIKKNPQINERNRKMQRKISIIIATDFLCWVPFIVTCCLHYFLILDATHWYSLFSIVILPINSVINPLLYDSKASRSILKPIRSLVRVCRQFCYRIISNRSNVDRSASACHLDTLPGTRTMKKASGSSKKMTKITGRVDKIYKIGNTVDVRAQPNSAKNYQQMSVGDPYFQLPKHKKNTVSKHDEEDKGTTASSKKIVSNARTYQNLSKRANNDQEIDTGNSENSQPRKSAHNMSTNFSTDMIDTAASRDIITSNKRSVRNQSKGANIAGDVASNHPDSLNCTNTTV